MIYFNEVLVDGVPPAKCRYWSLQKSNRRYFHFKIPPFSEVSGITIFFLTNHVMAHKKCDSADRQNPKIMKIHKELIKRRGSIRGIPEEAVSVGEFLLQVTGVSPSGVFCFHLFIKQLRE